MGRERIHALARDGMDLSGLPAATPRQRQDAGWKLEWTLWRANLALFFVALAGFVATLAAGATLWAVLTARGDDQLLRRWRAVCAVRA